MIPATLRALLAGLVDYAGLFPPAALDMPAAMREYHHQRTGADAWMLGAFVLPTARLAEFEAAQATVDVSGGPWRLSALPGSDIGSSLDDVARFNARSPIATIDAVEFKAEEPAAISAALARVPTAITAYVELPLDRDLVPLLAAIEAGGGRAKVRTGGITEAAFPPSHALARFIQACAQAGVPFKATAGLHHPLRGEYRLTYEAEPPHGMMFGFLNVFLAAAFARAGLDARQRRCCSRRRMRRHSSSLNRSSAGRVSPSLAPKFQPFDITQHSASAPARSRSRSMTFALSASCESLSHRRDPRPRPHELGSLGQ